MDAGCVSSPLPLGGVYKAVKFLGFWLSNKNPSVLCRMKNTCRRRPYTMKNSCVRRSPLKTKARVRSTLKNYKARKSVGFTATSSLKSMGLVPRSNGCYRLGSKYA